MSSSLVDRVDQRLDDVVTVLRGRRVADVAANVASALGDHGLVWVLIGLLRGRTPGPRRTIAVRAIAFTGIVTPIVNSALKSSVGRVRPVRQVDDPRPVRLPRSTSFPSGHTLTAWCAATLLAEDDPIAPAYYLLAVSVSLSRVHLRLHHATDVLAAAALGVALGRLGRVLLPVTRLGQPRRGMATAPCALSRA